MTDSPHTRNADRRAQTFSFSQGQTSEKIVRNVKEDHLVVSGQRCRTLTSFPPVSNGSHTARRHGYEPKKGPSALRQPGPRRLGALNPC
jgi:hypothetical protein